MRLQKYVEYWQQIYSMNIEESVNEVIDRTTKVDRVSYNKWSFWVGTDLYVVKVIKKGGSHYEVSFVHKDIETKEETSNIVSKRTPFKVMDGVVVVMVEVVEERNPDIIECNVYGDAKKANMFKRIMKLVIKKYPDIFGTYKIKEGPADLPSYGSMPDELKRN